MKLSLIQQPAIPASASPYRLVDHLRARNHLGQ
jgi:hypothetical protein